MWEKCQEKSWGTNGLMPTPPPMGCCLNPREFWELSPSVGWQRQFFKARSHQFLSEGSPSNVLPFCCAVTCVISQFIALWAGSFYHERFLSASFTLLLLLPRSRSLLCSALFAAPEVLWQDHSADTMWSQFTRLIIFPPFIMYWNLFLSAPSTELWARQITVTECLGPVLEKLLIYVNIQSVGKSWVLLQ